ncbi:MAG: hypothetical protein ACI94Y_004564 [Maribacter sp.]
MYWESDPDFYYKYDSVDEIPNWAEENYKLRKKVEKLIIQGKFPEKISYSPDPYRIPKEIDIFNKIPRKLLLPSTGKDGAVLCN